LSELTESKPAAGLLGAARLLISGATSENLS
jgi:hypothetical protein